MTNKKWAILLILISIPLLWWGFNQFIYGSGHSTFEAIAVSLSCTGGLSCLIGGIYMLFKGRGEDLSVSKTKISYSPIPKELQRDLVIQGSLARAWRAHKEPINKKQKVNEMAKEKEFELADAVEEFRSLGEDIKKANLVVKTATEKRAVLRDNIAKTKLSISEDGKLDTIKQ